MLQRKPQQRDSGPNKPRAGATGNPRDGAHRVSNMGGLWSGIQVWSLTEGTDLDSLLHLEWTGTTSPGRRWPGATMPFPPASPAFPALSLYQSPNASPYGRGQKSFPALVELWVGPGAALPAPLPTAQKLVCNAKELAYGVQLLSSLEDSYPRDCP